MKKKILLVLLDTTTKYSNSTQSVSPIHKSRKLKSSMEIIFPITSGFKALAVGGQTQSKEKDCEICYCIIKADS